MAVTYTIDDARSLVTLDYEASPTFDEYRSAMLALFADPRYTSGMAFLADRRRAEAPTSEYLRRVSSFLGEHRREVAGSRCAILVAGPVSYGMMRMGQVFVDSEPVACLRHESVS